MKRFKNKRVIVTGAASGIGQAVAKSFLNEGATVGLIDIDEKELQNMTTSNKENAAYKVADITKHDQLLEAISELASDFGGLDILHVNAGINGTWAPIEDLPLEEWDRTISTNLRSTFLSVKAAIPFMKENGGSIVITSSINGNRIYNNFGASAYSTSKAGQIAFMKMAALELAGYNIRVNAVCPGAIDTNIEETTKVADTVKEVAIPVEFPNGARPLKQETGVPEQVAHLVLFLSSKEAGNISGTEVYIDGAESLL